MQIIHKIDDFFYSIFPKAEMSNHSALIEYLEKFYSYGVIKPKVVVQNEFVIIEINTNKIEAEESKFKKVIALCESGKFNEAKPILIELINGNPCVSEYYRVLGQVLSEEGNQEEAINNLIDALRWDSKNTYALLMVGNIYAKYFNDIETARNYYNQVLVINPNDFIAMNNIGGQLMQSNKYDEAKEYFENSIKINEKYPNSYYALSLIADRQNDLHSAFYSANKAYKLCAGGGGVIL